MGKAKQSEGSAGGLPIDQESATVLEDQVKKGKARKFILIYKGAKINKLIVFKKGPFGTRIQKAKKEGFRGEAVCGIVTGSGVNLNFQLAGNQEVASAMSVDGVVDKEPTKKEKLKKFLDENNLTRKPVYNIVSDVKQLASPDDEDESEGGGNPAVVAAEAPAGDTPSGTATADALEPKCKQLKTEVVPKVKEAVAADPSSKQEIVRLLQSVTDLEKASSWDEMFEALTELDAVVTGALATPAAPAATGAESVAAPPTADSEKPADPNQAQIDAYKKELQAVKKLVTDLNKHAYKSHISGELTAIGTELGKADTAFKAKNFSDAMKALTAAKDTAGKAKGFADKYAAYAKKRAAADYLVQSFKDLLSTSHFNTQTAAITAADNLAKPPTRNYAAATTKVEGVVTAVDTTAQKLLNDAFVTPTEPKIQALKTGATKTFLADRIKAIDAQMSAVKANIAAKEYHKAIPAGWKVNELVRVAEATSTRRGAFDTQRPKTVTAIDGLKAFAALSTQMADLNKRLKAADDLATDKSRQFENAVEALVKIEADAKALAANGPAADAYAADRKLADTAYGELVKHQQAAKQKPLLDGIKTKLDKAAEFAKDVKQMAAANAELARAKRDIDTAKQALDEGSALGVVAGSAADAASGKQALDALKVSRDALKKHKHAAAVGKDFKAIDSQVKSAESSLKDSKKLAEALSTIKKIGESLAQVTLRLAQQEGYTTDRAALEDRLKKVKALPEAKEIKAKITPLEAALKDADAQNKAEAWDQRAEAMEKARAAAQAAEDAAAQCKAYNARASKLEAAVKASSLQSAEQKTVTDAIKLAAAKAKSLDYGDATKLLVKAEASFETLLINTFAKSSPPDLAKIEAAAKRMMKSGSAKEIDKLIQKLPDTTQHAVLKTLAKERFGIELKTDAVAETKSAKAMLEMLAKVPDDVIGNPSLKTVERRTPTKNGGFYDADKQLVVMNGRPGQSQQEFGANIASQLPNNVDPDCQPKTSTAVDYFDFATLHEVGHSVDDNLQFMASREGKAEFGGWKSYGGNIDPIVKAVTDWTGYNSTAEQKKAVSDLIMGNQVTWPTAPSGKEAAWATAKNKVIQWHGRAAIPASGRGSIWWSQSKTNKIDINGTVYHEAYKRVWISYNTAARKKGLTGYQFRAPGEWFAELYAAYRMDKLKPSHPAVKWLSKLKV